MEMTVRTGLYVLNVGTTTTFRRPGYIETIPDISLANEDLLPWIEEWKVIEDYTGSDHQYITFSVREELSRGREDKATPRRLNLHKMDTGNFIKAISHETEATKGLEATGKTATETLVGAIICHIVVGLRIRTYRARDLATTSNPRTGGLQRLRNCTDSA